MSYFDMILAKTLSGGGGGGGGSLPFPYKIVHVTFTPPADAVQTSVYAGGYYDETAKRIVSGEMLFDSIEQHSFDYYVTLIRDFGSEGMHYYRWAFPTADDLWLSYEIDAGSGSWLSLDVDWENCVFENCAYDNELECVVLGDADEATVTLAFGPTQA